MTAGTYNDVSDAVFTIGPGVLVTSPNGGEDWARGSTHDITWVYHESGSTAKLEYSTNNGGNWTEIVASTDNDGIHPWTVPAGTTTATQCLVRVTAGTYNDVSDAVFQIRPCIIVSEPTSTSSWTSGNSYELVWDAHSSVTHVDLAYSTDAGSQWLPVADNIQASSYVWATPFSVDSDQCAIRITDHSHPATCSGESQLFAIHPPTVSKAEITRAAFGVLQTVTFRFTLSDSLRVSGPEVVAGLFLRSGVSGTLLAQQISGTYLASANEITFQWTPTAEQFDTADLRLVKVTVGVAVEQRDVLPSSGDLRFVLWDATTPLSVICDLVLPGITGASGADVANIYYGVHRGASVKVDFNDAIYLEAGQRVRPTFNKSGTSNGVPGPISGAHTLTFSFTPDAGATDGDIYLTGFSYESAALGHLKDHGGNEIPSFSVQVEHFQIDNTYPTNLSVNGTEQENLGIVYGTPPNPWWRFDAAASDAHLTSTAIYEGGISRGDPWDANVWAQTSDGKTLEVRASDAASNSRSKVFSYTVDNPRITGYRSLQLDDPITTDGKTKVFPAGYPCTVRGEMQNGGVVKIPGAVARLGLMSGESEIIGGETSPADVQAESWSGLLERTVTVPTRQSPGTGLSLRMRHVTPDWATDRDTGPGSDAGYSIASAALRMTAVFSSGEMVAGEALPFCVKLAQDDNGGVASHAAVHAEGFDGFRGQHWTDGSLNLPTPATILSKSETACLALPGTREFVVDKRTTNDTTFTFTTASFLGQTDQWGASPIAHDGSRFTVQYQIGADTPTGTQSIRVANAVLASSAAETEEFAPWSVPVYGYWGQDLAFYIGIRNDRDVADPLYRLELDCPNDPWFSLDDNADGGWELKSAVGPIQTWVFDPLDQYPAVQFPASLQGAAAIFVPVLVNGRPDGYSTPDNITVRVYSDRRWTALSRSKQINWGQAQWNKRSMCYLGSPIVDAGAVLQYTLTLNAAATGTPNRAVQVLVSKDALDVMDLALNSPSKLALDKGTGADVAFTQEIQCGGTTTYYATEPQSITADTDVTWVLKAKTRDDLADNLSTVGLLRSAVVLSLEDGSCVGTDASACLGSNTLVTVRNVRLELTINAGSEGAAVVIPAGGSGEVQVTLTNRGGLALGSGVGEASVGSTFIAGVQESDHPTFNLADGLASGGSIGPIPWTITAAKNVEAKEGTMVPGLFQSLDGWCLKFPPVRTECRFVQSTDLVQTGAGVRITSPYLAVSILQTPTSPPTIPLGDSLTITVRLNNTGNQNGAATIAIDPIPGLTWLDGSGWPPGELVPVDVGPAAERVFHFRVNPDAPEQIDPLDKVHVDSEYRSEVVENQLTRLTVVGSALDIVGPNNPPASVRVREVLTLRYTVDNNQGSGSLTPRLTISAPALGGGVPASTLALRKICFWPDRNTDVGKVCREDYSYGTIWAGLPPIAWDKTGQVEVQIIPGLSIPNGTIVTPGNVKIEWDGGEDNASGAGVGITTDNCVIGTAAVTPTPLEPVAGGLVDYSFTITNTSGVPRPANPPLALLVSRPAGLSWASGNTALRDTLPFADSTATDVTVQFRIARDWPDLTAIDLSQFDARIEFLGDDPQPPIIDNMYEVGDYTAVAPRNVRFEIAGARIEFDSDEIEYLAGDVLHLKFTVENVGGVGADSVDIIVKYEHQVSGGSAFNDSLSASIDGGLESGDPPRLIEMNLPLSVERFGDGDGLKFRTVRVDAKAQGRDAPTDGTGGITELEAGTVKGLRVVCDIRRLDRVNGAVLDESAARLGVNKGAIVPFGLLLRNTGGVKQNGDLKIRLPLPEGLVMAGDSTFPRDDWRSETPEEETWLTLTRVATPTDWAQESAEELYLVSSGGAAFVPGIGLDTGAFSGVLSLRLADATIRGQYPVTGTRTVEPEFGFTTSNEPYPFNVSDCDATSLRTTLHLVGTQTAFQRGDQIPLRMEMLFGGDPELLLRGDLVLTATIKDDRFEFVRAALGEPVREWASVTPATEKTVVMRSTDIRGGSDNKVIWDLTIQATKLDQPGTVEVDLTSAIELAWSWTVRPGSSNDCGFDADQGGVGWDNVELWIEATHRGGEIVKLLGRPNPASQEMRICYDLEIGTTRVELFVTDLAGNLILHTVSSASRALGTSAGFNEFVWDVRDVSNGVYLARLEVAGTGTNGRSLRETRRAKLAVLK